MLLLCLVKRISKSVIILTLVALLLLVGLSVTPATQAAATTPVISAGSGHSLALRGDGSIWAWGFNGYGQLGDGTTIDRSTPVQVKDLRDVVFVDTGNSYSLVVKSNGTVWTWGRNSSGQLGDGTRIDRSKPGQVSNLTGVKAVSTGFAHALALKNDGTVWAWGYNDSGRLGDGTTIDRTVPVQVSGLTGVAAVSAGFEHSLAVKKDGTVWAWGQNDWGQLGDNSNVSRNRPVQVPGLTDIVAVSAGRYHSLALKEDGTVWAWGRNNYGQLGIGTRTSRIAPVQVADLTGVLAVSAGEEHSLAVRVDGTVWAWGNNSFGQLGDGTVADRFIPVHINALTGVPVLSAGSSYSLAVKSDGTVWAWGYNGSGGLGDGTTFNRTTPVELFFNNIITLRTNIAVGGSVAGSGNYSHGTLATVEATASEDHLFLNWTEKGAVVSNNAVYTFTVESDRTLMANFISVLDELKNYRKKNYTGLSTEESYKGIINQDQVFTLPAYTAPGGQDLVFLLGWSGTENRLMLSVKDPSGQISERTGNNMPLVVEAKKAAVGIWTIQVTGVTVPGDNLIFHVLIGQGKPLNNPNPALNRKLGDVNDDGRIDVSDAALIMRHVLGINKLDNDLLVYADINDDGRIDVQDAVLIMQMIMG